MDNEWYKEWFASEDYLNVYSHRNSEDTQNLISLILSHIEIDRNAKILDAGCGAGRHSIKLAELGYNVTGFDLSETLLDIAVRKSIEKNLVIDFLRADFRSFSTTQKFDLVVNLFTSFGYFHTDEENFLFAKNAFQMLNKSGYYVLDYLNKEFLEANLVDKTEKKMDDKNILENRKIIDGRVVKKISIMSNTKNREFLESVKLYSVDEILSSFNRIGYSQKNIFGDYNGNEFDKIKSERCIIIFQK